jgi:hypothetical protein
LQIACDQHYLATADFERLRDLARQISGMISNFIAHLQKSDYRGEKLNRPNRQYVEERQKRMEALRTAQLANMSRQKQNPPS